MTYMTHYSGLKQGAVTKHPISQKQMTNVQPSAERAATHKYHSHLNFNLLKPSFYCILRHEFLR